MNPAFTSLVLKTTKITPLFFFWVTMLTYFASFLITVVFLAPLKPTGVSFYVWLSVTVVVGLITAAARFAVVFVDSLAKKKGTKSWIAPTVAIAMGLETLVFIANVAWENWETQAAQTVVISALSSLTILGVTMELLFIHRKNMVFDSLKTAKGDIIDFTELQKELSKAEKKTEAAKLN